MDWYKRLDITEKILSGAAALVVLLGAAFAAWPWLRQRLTLSHWVQIQKAFIVAWEQMQKALSAAVPAWLLVLVIAVFLVSFLLWRRSKPIVTRSAVGNGRTLVVGIDHPMITKAIEAANPGDRILIRPGLYREGLVMDKPLEIIGEGSPGNVVVQARGKSALLFQTTMGLVTNLTLQQMEGGEWHCVDIAQGRLDLKGCDITSQSRACVAIHGGADPRLRCNRIHGGKFSGVYVYDNGRGTLVDNDIFENDRCGVKIDGGNLTLCHNRINENREDGVYVYDNGQGVLVDNDIFGNAHDGVEIKTGSNLTLRHNRINRNGYHAVRVYDRGAGTVEYNDLRDNARGAWNVSADSALNVNRAHNLE